jgi:hypothetical protein
MPAGIAAGQPLLSPLRIRAWGSHGPHHRFGSSGTDSLSEAGMKRAGGGATREHSKRARAPWVRTASANESTKSDEYSARASRAGNRRIGRLSALHSTPTQKGNTTAIQTRFAAGTREGLAAGGRVCAVGDDEQGLEGVGLNAEVGVAQDGDVG